jgi:hypothetical protein
MKTLVETIFGQAKDKNQVIARMLEFYSDRNLIPESCPLRY